MACLSFEANFTVVTGKYYIFSVQSIVIMVVEVASRVYSGCIRFVKLMESKRENPIIGIYKP